jgi:hypothetical protein
MRNRVQCWAILIGSVLSLVGLVSMSQALAAESLIIEASP